MYTFIDPDTKEVHAVMHEGTYKQAKEESERISETYECKVIIIAH